VILLLTSRRFLPLFCCQFFAAFNDNFLKTALVFLILFGGGGNAEALITAASAVFIAPYFFLSGLAGQLADRYDKARVAQIVKFVEIFVAALAVLGYAFSSLAILFTALAGFGVLAALFGPVKYGILPDHLTREQLPAGNALVEGATFIAILAGTIAGGLASRGHDVASFAPLLIGFAVACWLAARLIPPTGQGAPQLKVSGNIAASTAAMLRGTSNGSLPWEGTAPDSTSRSAWTLAPQFATTASAASTIGARMAGRSRKTSTTVGTAAATSCTCATTSSGKSSDPAWKKFSNIEPRTS